MSVVFLSELTSIRSISRWIARLSGASRIDCSHLIMASEVYSSGGSVFSRASISFLISFMRALMSATTSGAKADVERFRIRLLSYPRHAYFRRILCNQIGEWVENGEFPDAFEALSAIVCGISYDNAKIYFGL